MRHLIAVAAIALTAMAQPASAQEKPILHAGSEQRTPGEVHPSPQLVRATLATLRKEDLKDLDACLADNHLKRGDYAALLSTVKVPAGKGRNLWFVRASEEPYCQVFEGAHLFQYYLFEERPAGAASTYHLVFHNGGDEFAIYAKQSHGLNDIQATGCIVDECRSARLAYDGKKYRAVSCAYITDDERRKVRHPRRCGSDRGRDDQASGLWPDQ
jgi:hypothetical protein